MAVTAKFQADFSEFAIGVAEAEQDLVRFGATAGKAGGEIRKLALVTEQGVNPVQNLGTQMRQFDGALAAVGLSIGPQIRAIEDIAAASGKTATQLGGFATAGLAVGVAMAGWQLGRVIADWLGLDAAIAGATAKLIGYGDVAAETAGAKQDTINKAIANGADAMISYADAIVFNQKAHETWKGPVEAAAKLATFEASLKQTAFEAEHLTIAQERVIVEAVKVGKSYVEIANALGLTADAVELYVEKLALAEKAQTAAAAAADKLAVKTAPVAVEIKKVVEEEWAAEKAAHAMGDAMVAAFQKSQLEAKTLAEDIVRVREEAWAATKAGHALGGSFNLTEENAGDVAAFQGLDQGQLRKLLAEGYSPSDALDILRGAPKSDFTPKSGASGPTTASGGSGGGRDSTLSNLSIASRGDKAPIINVVMHVSGLLDPATKAKLVKDLSDEIVKSVGRGKKLQAA